MMQPAVTKVGMCFTHVQCFCTPFHAPALREKENFVRPRGILSRQGSVGSL